jgi:hypothetical protein
LAGGALDVARTLAPLTWYTAQVAPCPCPDALPVFSIN